eukprot:601624_1
MNRWLRNTQPMTETKMMMKIEETNAGWYYHAHYVLDFGVYRDLQCAANGYCAFGYELFSVLYVWRALLVYINGSGSQWYKFDGENSKQCVLKCMNCVINWMAMYIKIRGLRIYLRNDVWNMRCR